MRRTTVGAAAHRGDDRDQSCLEAAAALSAPSPCAAAAGGMRCNKGSVLCVSVPGSPFWCEAHPWHYTVIGIAAAAAAAAAPARPLRLLLFS